jgi:RNA polymerase sigma factor (sigma-70 family)
MPTMTPPGPAVEIGVALLDRARRGDQEAFAAVIRHYDPGLRTLAYRLLGDRDRMDDALQEAYVKAFRALPRFRGDSKLGTWLYRIAYNACLDELKRSHRVIQLPLEEIAEPASSWADPARRSCGGTISRKRSPRCRRMNGRRCSLSTLRASATRTPPRCSASQPGRSHPASVARGQRFAGP